MRCRAVTTLVYSWLCMSLIATLPAQADPAAAKRGARRAEALIERGDYEAAAASLATVDCRTDPACQTRLDFSYAWVYESWAEADPERGDALLGRALRYYQKAHEASPENAQILTNLALVARRLGKEELAAKAMTDAIQTDPDGTYQRYLFLGSALAVAGENAAASEAFRAAIEQDPADAQGHRRLLELYRRTASAQELFAYSQKIERSFPDLAALGYEYAIQLWFVELPEKAEKALPRWTALRCNLGWLSVPSLRSLPSPEEWKSPGLKQLDAVVRSNAGPPTSATAAWWLEDVVRKDALARLLRLKAATIRADANRPGISPEGRLEAQRTAIAYLKAAVDLSPAIHAYLRRPLARSSNVKIDATLDLVALHHSLEESDDLQRLSNVTVQEMERMTEILFSGKADAYAAGQLAAIQRYHTVLGMIYYETKRDNSGWADNATFQLEHALETADKIAQRDPKKYEPLPELKALLAKVHYRNGRKPEGARLSLEAAMGFLEVDNLPEASTALERAQKDGADPARSRSVAAILTGRQAVAASGDTLVQIENGSHTLRLGPEIAWLREPEALDLPDSFVEGQRFKTLADLSTQLAQAGDEKAARVVSSMAADAASKQPTLTSPTDVKRLQKIEYNSTGGAKAAPRPERNSSPTSPWLSSSSGRAQRPPAPVANDPVTIVIDENLSRDNKSVSSSRPPAPMILP